jgi:ATP adenylyltransferase
MERMSYCSFGSGACHRQVLRAQVSCLDMAKTKDILFDDIWPQERDVVVRPERLKYVRRIAKPKTCVFCEAATTKQPKEKLVVYKGKEAMVLLNKYPYNSGHILVMPLRHEGALESLTDSEHTEVTALVKESVRILKKVYQCTGINVGMNLGAAAGAGIPDHLHYHVIPRWHGDTNFFPLIAETKLIVENLESTMAKLVVEFDKFSKSKKTTTTKKRK